ncbi:uncharacterized protein LOC113289894 isoform X2 [Papaver somniferum]|nr:uncharacterized protein LOC113289894 isoform X2 [Papaver somniferum]
MALNPSVFTPDEIIYESVNEWHFSLIGRRDLVHLKISVAAANLRNQWKLTECRVARKEQHQGMKKKILHKKVQNIGGFDLCPPYTSNQILDSAKLGGIKNVAIIFPDTSSTPIIQNKDSTAHFSFLDKIEGVDRVKVGRRSKSKPQQTHPLGGKERE